MNFINKLASKSASIYCLNSGSCNGCDTELVSLLASKYDIDKFGLNFVSNPKHADIIIVTGLMLSQVREIVYNIIDQVSEPKVTVFLGECLSNCNIFNDDNLITYAPYENLIEFDIYIKGCPPKPEIILENLIKAKEILKDKLSLSRNK